MRCVSSFFFTALPSPFDAEMTSAASFSDLDHRFQVGEGLLEDVHTGLARARLDEIHGGVEDPLGRALLALVHQHVDELRDGLAIVARVGQNGALYGTLAAAHFFPPADAFGFFVPYF